MTTKKSLSIALCGWLLLGSFAACGCARKAPLNIDRLRGDGFKGEMADYGEGLRQTSEDDDDLTGLSTRAREIERHLGL